MSTEECNNTSIQALESLLDYYYSSIVENNNRKSNNSDSNIGCDKGNVVDFSVTSMDTMD